MKNLKNLKFIENPKTNINKEEEKNINKTNRINSNKNINYKKFDLNENQIDETINKNNYI